MVEVFKNYFSNLIKNKNFKQKPKSCCKHLLLAVVAPIAIGKRLTTLSHAASISLALTDSFPLAIAHINISKNWVKQQLGKAKEIKICISINHNLSIYNLIINGINGVLVKTCGQII